jgi:RNA polymerase sigma-70 factor, ECF subfamily
LQAATTPHHLQPEPDWAAIADLYSALGEVAPSPVVEINRAVAVGFAEGPDAGLDVLESPLGDPRLRGYAPLHAAHADLLRRAGDAAAADAAYELAIEAADNEVQRAELTRRRATA